jgi:hypothetical protein
MFIPQSADLAVYKGSSFIERFNLTVDGLPFESDGWKARMQIRETIESTVVVIELTTENGGISFVKTNDTEGKLVSTELKLYIAPAVTEAINVQSGVYDIELVDASGDIGRLLEGSVVFNPEVTR